MSNPRLKVSELKFDDRNANKGTVRGNAALEQSLQKLGAGRSILIDRNGKVIAGNKTAAKYGEIGLDEIIVIQTDGSKLVAVQRTDLDLDSDPRARELAFADNRIGELDLDWDLAALQEAATDDIDLTWLWTDDELQDLLDVAGYQEPGEDSDDAVADDIDAAASGKIESRVKLGEIWALGRHRIACGDSTDEGNVKNLLDGKSAGMVWSDPPYGINFQSNFRTKSKKFEVLENDNQIFSDYLPVAMNFTNGWFLICTTWRVLNEWIEKTRTLGEMTNLIVWDKGGGGLGDLTHSLLTDYELIMAFNRGETIKGKRIGSVWSINKDNPNAYMHPTQKPSELLTTAFECFSTPDDLIFDPFLGSAPSIIAAQQMDGSRTVYGFELSPEYCEVICRRYERLTGEVAELAGYL